MLAGSAMRSRLLAATLIALVALATYAASVGYQFTIYDDTLHIAENPRFVEPGQQDVLAFWKAPYAGLYVPVTYTAWLGLAHFAVRGLAADGTYVLSPAVFHGANVVLHALNALLVWWLLRRLKAGTLAATAGALLFTLHPLQVETVAWVSCFRDLLCAAVCFGALLAYLERGRGSYLLSTALYLVALLSKPSSVSLPLVALVLDRCVADRTWRQSAWRLGGWLAGAVPIVLLTASSQSRIPIGLALPLWQRPLIALDSLGWYAVKFLTPWNLGPDYGRTPMSVVAGADYGYVLWLVPVALAGLLLAWQRLAPLRAPAAVAAASLVPVIGLAVFTFQGISTVADRYVYFAMLGPAWALSYVLDRVRWPRVATGAGVAALLAGLAALTLAQERHWENNETLFRRAIAVNPQSWLMHFDLSLILSKKGDLKEALAEVTESIRIRPNFPGSRYSLVTLLSDMHDDAGAVRAFESAVAEKLPPETDAYNNLGRALYHLGRFAEAEAAYRKGLESEPGNPTMVLNLALALRAEKHYADARTLYEELIRTRPMIASAHFGLADLLVDVGDPSGAIREYEAALRLHADFPEAHCNLGVALAQVGRLAEAEAQLLEALRLVPGMEAAKVNLEQVRAHAGTVH